MDKFTLIYRILKFYEKCLECEDFPKEQFKAEYFKVSDVLFVNIIEMLLKDGYIDGIVTAPGTIGFKLINPRITIKGLEYLHENSMMKKISNAAKNFIDIVKP